jgi:hypothetical protein
MTIPTTSHVVVPHFHRHYDETIFGVDGITTWTVDGVRTEIGPGGQLFIPRGSRHTYANLHPGGARIICLVTPGLLGPEYFYELAYAMDEDGPTDYAAIGLVMSRYGIVPVNTNDTPARPLITPYQKDAPTPMPRNLGAD